MSAKSIKNVTLIALAVFCSCALANPDGPQVVSGSATFSQPNANTLNVTNSHNAIINWQGFNIGAGQTTNFIQPSRNSAVLNRVLSNNPSSIYGNLNSNGKVFLINQHGLMIGAGARINTAGFYGSTLNITNEDFLKGKLNFNGGGFGGIQNHGYIHAGPGGNVVLIAPDIENGGVIEVDNGKVILAAGESIRITSLNDASIEFDVQSHDDNSIINLGDIIAKQGAARLFAGNLKHSGSINATGIVKNADGSISLVAQADIEITAGATITADGEEGGDIRVQSLQGDVRFSGAVSAQGESGQGGRVEILGDRVGLFGDAKVDASGKTGGGDVLIGGDYQGQGDIQTAIQTQVGGDASIHADAIESGDGGKVIVWADDFTLFNGEATATGGAVGGDGGFIEISAKGNLGYYGSVDASADHGAAGSILFDPIDVVFQLGGALTMPSNPLDFSVPGALLTFDPLALTAITDLGSNVIVRADRDIMINDNINTSEGGSGGDITLQAGQSILINADIFTDNGSLQLFANDLGANSTNRGAGQSEIRMAPGTTIDAGAGNIELWMNSGVAGSSGDITLDNLNASHIVIKHNGLTDGSDILQNSGSVITASSLFIDHDGPANSSIGSAANPLNLVVDSLGAHIHAPTTGGIFIDAQPISTGVTVGNTCYGTGTAPGCDTFGSHLIKGLETVNGGGDISFNVAGDIVVIEPIRVDDVFSIGNAGDIALAATGTIISNADIFNNIVGGGIDFSATNVSLNSGTYRGLITTSGAGNPVVNGAVNFAGVALDIGSTLTLNANTLTMLNSSTFDGLLVVNGGTLNLAGTTLTLNSGLNWTNTSVISSGVLNLPLGAVFNISTGVTNTFDNIAVNIAGNTNYSAGNLGLQNGSSISNSGIFDFAGNIGIADFGGATSSFSNLDGGLIVKSAGATSSIDSTVSSSNAGSVDVQTGSLDLNLPSWTIGVGDTLSGNGTYIGNVINNGGIVRPGGQGSVGTLTVFGDFTNNLGKLEIEIDSAVTHDVLAVTNTLGYGNVTGSILDISLIAFVPSAGEMHNVITCVASCDTTTQFGTVIEPGGVTHNISYNANDLNLTVAAAAFFWDGGGALNNWFDPLNWSLDILPNPGTDVVLVNGDSVIFDGGAVTIASLTLNIGSSLNLTTGTLTNTGILTINAGASMAVSGGNLVNNGNANLAGNFGHSSGNAAFNANVASNGIFNQGGGVETFTGTADFNGSLVHSGGSATFNGFTSLPGSVNLNGGAMIFNAGATMNNHNNSWSGGTIGGSSTLTLGSSPGDTTLAIGGAAIKTLDTITLDMNRNDISMSGGGNLVLASGASIDNTSGMSFYLSGNGNIVGNGSFINNGASFNKLSGSSTISVDFVNDASSTVSVAGGTLALDDVDVNDQGTYYVANDAKLLFVQDRNLNGALNMAGSVAVGSGATLTLPATLNNTGSLQLNNAVLDLTNLSGVLQLTGGASLGGTGNINGAVNNIDGVVVVGGAGAIGNLDISGAYTQYSGSALVVEVFNNGVNTVSDQLVVNGPTTLNGGALVVGFTTNSLGLVTADFRPLDLRGGVSGQFSQIFDAGGNILSIDFSGGVFTVLGASPVIPDSVIDDLIAFLDGSEELSETIVSNKSEAEVVMEELLEAADDEPGSLVCK